jgi:hypothetical protein
LFGQSCYSFSKKYRETGWESGVQGKVARRNSKEPVVHIVKRGKTMFTKDVKMFLASVAAAVSLTGCGDWQGKIQPSSQEDTLATQKIGNGNFDLVAIQGATENGDSCVRLLAGQTQ